MLHGKSLHLQPYINDYILSFIGFCGCIIIMITLRGPTPERVGVEGTVLCMALAHTLQCIHYILLNHLFDCDWNDFLADVLLDLFH